MKARRTPIGAGGAGGWCLALLLLGFAGAPVAGQGLLPVQGLAFGTLLPGTPVAISVDDPRRAILDVVGSGDLSLRVLPPPAMYSVGGHPLPLSVGPRDAVLRWQNGNTFPLTPGATTNVRVPPGQAPAVIHIGGTALPAANQPPGVYSGTIVVQIVPPGT